MIMVGIWRYFLTEYPNMLSINTRADLFSWRWNLEFMR